MVLNCHFIFTVQYLVNLQLCCKFSSSVCVLHRPETFSRKHSLAHRRQNNLSIQSTDTQWPGRVTGSKSSGSGRVGEGHESKVQIRFHLCAVDIILLLRNISSHAARGLLSLMHEKRVHDVYSASQYLEISATLYSRGTWTDFFTQNTCIKRLLSD